MRRKELEKLLYKNEQHREFIPRHLLATAAWLSLWDAETRSRLISIEPKALIDEGDPSGLSVQDKEAVLDAYLSLYSQSDHLDDHYDYAKLKHFAQHLSGAVKSRLARTDLPDEAASLLLKLITYGNIVECVDEALSWALKSTAESRTRCSAMEAISSIANESVKRRLVRELLQTNDLPQVEAGVFLWSFYPEFMTTTEMFQILNATRPEAPNHYDLYTQFVSRGLPDKCPTGERRAVISTLIDIHRRRKGLYRWLQIGIQNLTSLVIESMNDEESPSAEIEASLVMLVLEDKSSRSTTPEQARFDAAVKNKPAIRRWLFWRKVKESESRFGRKIEHVFQIPSRFTLDADDIPWIIQDARTAADSDSRKLSFRLLLALKEKFPEAEVPVAELEKEIAQSAAIVRDEEERRSHVPEPDPFMIEMQQEDEARRLAEEKAHEETLKVLHENLETVRSGENIQLLSHVRMDEDVENMQREFFLEKVATEFGKDIAEAVASGMKAYWRTVRPPFYFEQDDRNFTTFEILVGLAGLDLDFADKLDPRSLHPNEIENAVRYALRQINGLPKWFEHLSNAHPQRVMEILTPAISADLGLKDADHWPEFLAPIRQLPKSLHVLFAHAVLTELEKEPPVHERSLEYAISISTLLSDDESSRFAKVCSHQTEIVNEYSLKSWWWLGWAECDPIGATKFLEQFAKESVQEHVDTLITSICAKMDSTYGDRKMGGKLFLSVDALKRLIPLAYTSIRLEDEKKEYLRTAHVVTDRNRAENVRGLLLGKLSAIGSYEAVEALEDLAEDPRMAARRDSILIYARRCLPDHSHQAAPMTPEDAVNWSATGVVAVKNSDDLFRVVLDRLDDIREFIERGEFSYRETFRSSREPEFQKFISQELRHRNRHDYTIGRENEVDRQNRTDIRVEHSACADHPVTIEVKILENWTLTELKDALQNQLVGQYLRKQNSRHGILLLCSRGESNRLKRFLSQEELNWMMDTLKREADDVAKINPDVEDLEIICIDFH